MSVKNHLPGGNADVGSKIHPVRSGRRHHCHADLFGDIQQAFQLGIRRRKQIIVMLFGNDQSMAGVDRFNIQKRQVLLVFVNFFRRNIPFYYFAKNATHITIRI